MRQWEDEQKARASKWTSSEARDALDYRLRAAGWRILKEWDKALADYNEAIRLETKHAGSYRQRADIHSSLSARSLLEGGPHQEELERAIADYSTAIALDPRDAESRLRRAHLWWNKNEYDKAFADCDEAVRLDDGFAQAYADRGKFRADKANDDFVARTSRLRGDQQHFAFELDKAIADYGEALRADRLYLDAYDYRATARMHKGEYAKAVDELTQAVRLAKTNPRFYSLRAQAQRYAGDLDAALADLSSAIRLDGPHPEVAYEARGDMARKKGIRAGTG
jgi:tetratricopeptide (TPR) repeat protein